MQYHNLSEITQAVKWKTAPNHSYLIVEDAAGNGYRRSLKRNYMKEVREALDNYEKEGDDSAFHRILFLTGDVRLARQAYLVIRKALNSAQEQEPEDQEYAQLYAKCGIDTQEKRTRVVTIPQQMDPNECCLEDADCVPQKKRGRTPFGDGRGKSLEQAESVMVEIGSAAKSDEEIDELLELANPWVAVTASPAGSCEYLTKRMVFEGGYLVIRLDNLNREDLLDCALSYLGYHHCQAKQQDLEKMLGQLQAYRGSLMNEMDIYLHLDRCLKKMGGAEKGAQLTANDLSLEYPHPDLTILEKWKRLVGLEKVKSTLERKLQAKRVMHGRGVVLHGNYIFAGNPGTGKSEVARLLAERLGEMGITNGRFEIADRADLIGQYLGQTAAKVKELFERADGGVLFIDEAAFLLEKEDRYVQEAVVELVRFMESRPQTTVLFATYPHQARELLDIDPGFRSRIQQILHFADYQDEELIKILQVMAKTYGFALEEGCDIALLDYLHSICRRKNYGNAREVRKLLETAIEEFGLEDGTGSEEREAAPEKAVSCEDGKAHRKAASDGDGKAQQKDLLCSRHFRRAAEYLLSEQQENDQTKVGFAV